MKIFVIDGKLYIGEYNNKSELHILCDNDITDLDGQLHQADFTKLSATAWEDSDKIQNEIKKYRL